MAQTAAELRELLKLAEENERKAADERRKAVKPVYRYTFEPVDGRKGMIDFYTEDGGIRQFYLLGTVTNKAELVAAGHSDQNMDGGMVYLVNIATPTPKLVCASGGGRYYFNLRKRRDIADALNEFLTAHPDGGDVTHIIPQEYQDGW